MKKKIKLLLGIFLFVIICFLTYKITSKLNYKKEVAERVKVIPDFSFYRLDGSKFSTKNLQKKPSVFVYFNSECNYCKSETKKIQERLEDFKEVQLIFISFEKKEIIQQFAKDYELLDQENVLFLEDRKGEFSKLFDVTSIPFMVIYDEQKKLLKKFKGATNIDAIVEVLQ